MGSSGRSEGTGKIPNLPQILRLAAEKKWCTRRFCTTCGSTHYRRAIGQLAGPLGGPILKDLEEVDFNLFFKLEDWRGGVAMALDALPFQPQLDQILEAWAAREPSSRIVDVVLFDQVRTGRASSKTGARWVELARSRARQFEDTSLLETLALTLGEGFSEDPLFEMATKLSSRDPRLARVMRRYV